MADSSKRKASEGLAADSDSTAYRPEIDGLRAIAVLATMLFHAQIPYFDGGFLGVDVFFAISGFLITGIIVRSAARGQFSLAGFYMRRIRRIIPALSVMCLVVLPVAWWAMMPDDLENFGQSMVATAVSANNILLYLTTGYFQLEAAFKPLRHTWSLGVEEQYYVIAPLLLLLSLRLGGRRGVIAFLAATTALSLGWSEYIRTTSGAANYLLLPSRFWELSLGGLTAMLQPGLLAWFAPRQRLRQALAALGLAMVLFSLFWLTERLMLPGWQSLVPVGGTCLVLALADTTGTGRLLSSRPMVGIGLISYSAYLYHQPLDALLRIVSLETPTLGMLAAVIPFSLFLAWLSWRFVERPFRNTRQTSNRQVLQFCAAATALMVGFGLMLHSTSGLYSRWPELAEHDRLFGARHTQVYNEGPFVYQGRPFGTANRARNMLVIGDSFARDFINMGLETNSLDGLDLSYSSEAICTPWSAGLEAQIRKAGAVVLGSGVYEAQVECVRQAITRLESLGVAHVAVLGVKNFGFNNNAIMRLPEKERYAFRARPLPYIQASGLAARRAIPAKYYVDLLALLDDGTATVPVFTPERKFMSQDRMHLTKAGATYLGEKVFAQPQFSWLKEKRD